VAHQTIGFVVENREAIITLLLALIAILRLTAWGRAQAAALDAVVGAIECLGSKTVKSAVSQTQRALPTAVQDAIVDAVAKADPKKNAPAAITKIVREALRGL